MSLDHGSQAFAVFWVNEYDFSSGGPYIPVVHYIHELSGVSDIVPRVFRAMVVFKLYGAKSGWR